MSEKTPRITWDDVQAVYPDIPLAQLQSELESYGLPLDDLIFEVITEGSWVGWSNEDQGWLRHETPDFWPFEQGGILLITESGREPFGSGRKSVKWWVGSVCFGTLAEAKARSGQVKAATPVGCGDPSDYDYLFEEMKP